jgi:NAD(P)-dependent dehydrogenase (short-subunit alcohol dehydrogenase family)
MNGKVAGKVAVVTGSTGGIGEGIARLLATEGAAIVVSGRRIDQGERVVREIRKLDQQAIFVQADLADEKDCTALIQSALDHFGHLDILVNNAAIFPDVPLEEETTDQWDQVFAINVRGTFCCTRESIPPMRQQGAGSIINIGSTLAYRSGANRLAYACSKGALLTMTKVLARELLADHIRVNWVTVGWVMTPGEIELRNQIYGASGGLAYLEEKSQKAPLGRLETVEDIAAGVLYLASEEASHVTGCELNISGGLWI